MTILALHSQGIVGEQLCQLAAAAHNTVYALLRSYRDGGLKNVYQYDKHKPVCQLEEYSEQIVKEFTERPSVSINEAGNRIDLVYLPAYSPNLNLIERYWKFLKKECLYNRYYEKFEDFCSAIDKCVAETPTRYLDKMKSLNDPEFPSVGKLSIPERVEYSIFAITR